MDALLLPAAPVTPAGLDLARRTVRARVEQPLTFSGAPAGPRGLTGLYPFFRTDEELLLSVAGVGPRPPV